jgi:hypothetical protein
MTGKDKAEAILTSSGMKDALKIKERIASIRGMNLSEKLKTYFNELLGTAPGLAVSDEYIPQVSFGEYSGGYLPNTTPAGSKIAMGARSAPWNPVDYYRIFIHEFGHNVSHRAFAGVKPNESFAAHYLDNMLEEEYLASAVARQLHILPDDYLAQPFNLIRSPSGKPLSMAHGFGSYLHQVELAKDLDAQFNLDDILGKNLTMNEAFQKLSIINVENMTKREYLTSSLRALEELKEKYGFASGGFIRGPGTGKSDSIPAYLSNGEFVVNAQSAKNNLGLLHAINNGETRHFEGGGGVGDLEEIVIKTSYIFTDMADAIIYLNKQNAEYIRNVKTLTTLFEATPMVGNTRNQALNYAQIGGFRADESKVNRATDSQLDKFYQLSKDLATKKIDLEQAELTGINVRKAQKAYDSAIVEIENFMEKGLENMAEKMDKAGEDFVSSVGSNLSTALKDILTGNKDFDDAGKALIGAMASSVIDNLVKGIMDPLTGEGGILTDAMKNLGKGVYGLGGKGKDETGMKSLPELFGFKKKKKDSEETEESTYKIPGEDLTTPFQKPLFGMPGLTDKQKTLNGEILAPFQQSTFGQNIMPGEHDIVKSAGISKPEEGASMFGTGEIVSAVAGVTAAVTSSGSKTEKAIMAILGFLPMILQLLTVSSIDFFAKGGKVSGSGNGTSDSIPAMLSNGEFVINAKATSKHLKLLTAINNNRIRKFADGGLVGSSVLATPKLIPITTEAPSSSKSSVFNINITGDISRQTKSEIYRMLPSIAEGVNIHNKEKGYKNQAI